MMKLFVKRLLCQHDYAIQLQQYGASSSMIFISGSKSSRKCSKCGKVRRGRWYDL